MCDTVSPSEIIIAIPVVIINNTHWASKQRQTLPSVKIYNQFHLANEI